MGRFVVPELPVKMGPQIQAEKNKDTTKTTITPRYPTLLSAERSVFGEKKEEKCFFVPWAVGLCVSKETSKDHSAKRHYKTRGSVVNHGTPKSSRTRKTRNTKRTTTPNHRTENIIKQGCFCFMCCSFFGCCRPNNQNRTTKLRYSKTTNKQQKQEQEPLETQGYFNVFPLGVLGQTTRKRKTKTKTGKKTDKQTKKQQQRHRQQHILLLNIKTKQHKS